MENTSLDLSEEKIAKLTDDKKALLEELKTKLEAAETAFAEGKKAQNEKRYNLSSDKEAQLYIHNFVTKKIKTKGLEAKGLYLVTAAVMDAFGKVKENKGELLLSSTDIQALWYFVQNYECENFAQAEKFTFGLLEPMNAVLPQIKADIENMKPLEGAVNDYLGEISALVEGIEVEKELNVEA